MFKFDIWNLWLIILVLINRTIAEISLSPQASWDQTATTVAGWTNGATGSSLSQLNGAKSISMTSDDVLYITDRLNNRIVVVQLGSITWTFIIGSGPGSNSSQFNAPYGLFVTNTSLYIADTNNDRVQKSLLNGSDLTTTLSLNGTVSPFYLYVDNNGNIYLSDNANHRVLLFLSNSTNGTMVAGTGVSGSNSNELNYPYGIFVSHIGTIYIADWWNHRIMKWFSGASSGILVAGDGTAGSSSTQLNCPVQIIVDTNEYMYISEGGNSRITRWAPNSTFGVCIAACMGTIGIALTQLNGPCSLTFDSNGSLYVSDSNNNRVQKFQILNNYNETTTSQQMLTSMIENIQSSTVANPSTDLSRLSVSTSQTTISHQAVQQPPPSFVPSACSNSTNIGLNCNISSVPCDLLKPCQNNGTCFNNDTIRSGYLCSCLSGFNGIQCQFDLRPCQLNTCWNNGKCNETSNTTFVCLCELGWEGVHCETKVNYCQNITCQNNGVCRSLFLNYSCECLGDSYSGLHCQIIANKIVVLQIVSKSFAYIAILAMVGVALFIVIMDLLKYYFGIDPVGEELEQIRKKKQARKRKPPVIIRFIYVNIQPPTSATEETAV